MEGCPAPAGLGTDLERADRLSRGADRLERQYLTEQVAAVASGTQAFGGWRGAGETLHNNPHWVAEVNRLAPRLGFAGVLAGRKRVRRVPLDGPLTVRGKRPTKPARVDDGNVPFGAEAGFPWDLRIHLGQAEGYYRQPALPSLDLLPTRDITP